jgi:hypothetical protein
MKPGEEQNGKFYTMEAEPFPGAIAPGFKQTEWTVLRYLAEINRQYRLLVVNEVDKADYLDHLELLAVEEYKGHALALTLLGLF